MRIRESAFGGQPEAARLRDIHSKPLAALPPGTYRCPRCDIVWWQPYFDGTQVSCTVKHSAGECCHYGQITWVPKG